MFSGRTCSQYYSDRRIGYLRSGLRPGTDPARPDPYPLVPDIGQAHTDCHLAKPGIGICLQPGGDPAGNDGEDHSGHRGGGDGGEQFGSGDKFVKIEAELI